MSYTFWANKLEESMQTSKLEEIQPQEENIQPQEELATFKKWYDPEVNRRWAKAVLPFSHKEIDEYYDSNIRKKVIDTFKDGNRWGTFTSTPHDKKVVEVPSIYKIPNDVKENYKKLGIDLKHKQLN